MSESIPEVRRFVTSLSLEECVDRAKPHPDLPSGRETHRRHHAHIIGSGRHHTYSLVVSPGAVWSRIYGRLQLNDTEGGTVIVVQSATPAPESFMYGVAIVVVTFPV